ncbi:MAG: ABC transporter substrate-binding protein [Parvularculales bacterium]
MRAFTIILGRLRVLVFPVLAAVAFIPSTQQAMAQTESRAGCGKVTIAEMSWDSGSILANVESIILSEGYGCDTELVPGDTVPTVTSMAEKAEPDFAPEMGINSVREIVEKAVEQGVIKVAGQVYSGGSIEAWWIPRYVVDEHPELTTIEAVLARPDLFPDKEDPGKGRFYTCPAGWACQIIDKNLAKAYGFEEAGFNLFDPGSGEGLAGAIAKAYERRQPIFAYYWTPTPLLSRYEMVELKGAPHDPDSWACASKIDCPNPQKNMYPESVVVKLVSSAFADRAPEAFEFISRVSMTSDEINSILIWKEDHQATPYETALYFLEKYEYLWSVWVSDSSVVQKVKASL